ncbi:MAG: hypothetical protein KF812_10850 [Fimbriimonadaceae bacterium]|nr:hypothetical protein [Fimbriimonadaceae bacterium]
MTLTAFLLGAAIAPTQLTPHSVWVEFPQPVESRELELKGEPGVLKRTAWELPFQDSLMRVDVITFSPEALSELRDDEILDRARDGAQTMTKFVVLNHKYVRVDGSPGRQFDIQVEHGPLMRHMILLRRPLVVHALVVGPKESVDSDSVKAFFASVRFTPPSVTIRPSGGS